MWHPLATLLSALALSCPQAPAVVTNWQPTWSPDGKWVAYASDCDGSFGLWKTDGVHVRRVARNGGEPAWSPDGKEIAFAATDPSGVGNDGVQLVASSGASSVRRRLTREGSQPNWSPDGRKVAYINNFSIWSTRRKGTGQAPLLTSPDEQTDYLTPAWSPDGDEIAYSSPPTHAIGIVNATGEPSLPLLIRTPAVHPSWSPDDRQIVYAAPKANTGQASREFGPLYIVDLRTQRVRRLTRMLGNSPAWSPGGKRIAFAARAADGSADIYLVNPDGSRLARLTHQPT